MVVMHQKTENPPPTPPMASSLLLPEGRDRQLSAVAICTADYRL